MKIKGLKIKKKIKHTSNKQADSTSNSDIGTNDETEAGAEIEVDSSKSKPLPKPIKVILKILSTLSKILRIAIRLGVTALIIIALVFSLVAYGKIKPIYDRSKALSYIKMSSISDGSFINEHNTQIFDCNNNLLGEINISNFEYATIDNISPYIKSGYMAVEDRNFQTHSGIDYTALIRASVSLLRHRGEVTQGGSTITQQVLKNNVLTDLDSNWERKAVEFFLAPEFEKSYTKDQIMEYYCNTNYYGEGCYGVESASQFYFGKSAKDLTLAEAAGLCGLSNSPNRFDPAKNLEAYKERREKVLSDMLSCGYITQVQFNESNKDEVELALVSKEREKENYMVSFALDCTTLREMKRQGFEFKYMFETKYEYDAYNENYSQVYAETAKSIRDGGYKIYTTLNPELQAKLQEYVDKEMSPYQQKAEDGRYKMQASATVVDNKTGNVIAIVGGRGTADEFNRAYQSFRQPGSCAKPVLAYAPGFDTGFYYPSKLVKDKKTDIAPSNWDGVYRGEVSIREALERSINVAAFNVMQDVTPRKCVSYIAKMKFRGLSYLDTYNGSMAVGGFTYGTTTFEMAKAYQTFVNNGLFDDKDCVTSIQKLEDGQMIEVFNELHTSPTQVYNSDSAYMIIDSLKGVLTESWATGTAMAIEDVPAAGKTGTTNSNKDGWFCGMTPLYTISVWSGYDIPQPISDMGGGKYPGAIYKDMMTYLMQDHKDIDFEKPDTVDYYCINGKGEKVDYETGKKDLFSTELIREKELAEAEQQEENRRLKDEMTQKEQAVTANGIRQDIIAISNTKISTLAEYEQILYKIEPIQSRIDNLISSITREELGSLLDNTVLKFKSKYSSLSTQYNEQKAAEERAKAEKEEQTAREVKATRIASADEALTNLAGWRTSSVARMDLITVASNAVNKCKGYDEYADFKLRYDTIIDEIEVYKQSIAPVRAVPIVDGVSDTTTETTTQAIMETYTESVIHEPVIS